MDLQSSIIVSYFSKAAYHSHECKICIKIAIVRVRFSGQDEGGASGGRIGDGPGAQRDLMLPLTFGDSSRHVSNRSSGKYERQHRQTNEGI